MKSFNHQLVEYNYNPKNTPSTSMLCSSMLLLTHFDGELKPPTSRMSQEVSKWLLSGL